MILFGDIILSVILGFLDRFVDGNVRSTIGSEWFFNSYCVFFRCFCYCFALVLDCFYVICECENPSKHEGTDYAEFAGTNYLWTGDLHYMGLGIFAKDNIKLEPIEGLDERFKNFIAVRVNDSFNLLAVWAMNEDKELGLNKYVEMIHDYVDANSDLFDENLVMCGDFNSNAIWDDKHKAKDNDGNAKNQTNLNIKLNNKGLYSVYHELKDEKQGEETHATFFQTKHLNQPYYIDYVYAKKGRFLSLKFWTFRWACLSDHLPLVFEFD